MATISPVVQETSGGKGGRFIRYLWETVTEADTAASINTRTQSRKVSRSNVKTDILVQATGTFGSATLTVQQSQDGTTFYTAKDVFGNDATLTAAGSVAIHDDASHLRFSFSGGTGQDVDVSLTMRFLS